MSKEEKCQECRKVRSYKEEKWYVFLEDNSDKEKGGVCASCWNQNQEKYKQEEERIAEADGEGAVIVEPLIKDKCRKCQATTWGDNYTCVIHNLTHYPGDNLCWNTDKCNCDDHSSVLMKFCPNRYSEELLCWHNRKHLLEQAKENDPNLNNKSSLNREREREREREQNSESNTELQWIQQYLQDNNIVSIELNDNQLAITFNERSERGAGTLWTSANTSELKQVQSYLQNQGKKSISLAELTQSKVGKKNYWPWIIGGLIGGGLIIGLAIWFLVRKKKGEKQNE